MHVLGSTRILLVALASALVVGLLGTAPAQALQSDPDHDWPDMPASCGNYGDKETVAPAPCYLTRWRERRPTVVMWGDSHAWQWSPAVRAIARDRRINLVSFYSGYCPPMTSVIRNQQEYRRAGACQQTAYLATNFVQRLDREGRQFRVLLGGAWQRYRAILTGSGYYRYGLTDAQYRYLRTMARFFESGGPRLFRMLGRRGIGTDVIGQAPVVPDPEYSPCDQANYGCPYLRTRSLPDEAATKAWVQRLMRPLVGRSRLINVADAVCVAAVCPGLRDGVYTFFNPLHISATRAQMSREVFLPTMRDALR